MDKYFNLFREMISLRGLSDHTLLSYCTYIRSYLDYLERILKKNPENVSWAELRDFIRWLQNDRNLSDRTVNTAIAQLRFFTIYVLHKPWMDFQLPFLMSLPRKIPGSLSLRFRTFASKRLFPSCILPVCVPVKSGILSILI